MCDLNNLFGIQRPELWSVGIDEVDFLYKERGGLNKSIDVTMSDSEQTNQAKCCCDIQSIRQVLQELFTILMQQLVVWI